MAARAFRHELNPPLFEILSPNASIRCQGGHNRNAKGGSHASDRFHDAERNFATGRTPSAFLEVTGSRIRDEIISLVEVGQIRQMRQCPVGVKYLLRHEGRP